MRCWGNNDRGQLGDGTTISSATPVATIGLTDATALSLGGLHSCAIKSDHTVQCWGFNFEGQLGNGMAGYFSVPQQVLGSPFIAPSMFVDGFEDVTP